MCRSRWPPDVPCFFWSPSGALGSVTLSQTTITALFGEPPAPCLEPTLSDPGHFERREVDALLRASFRGLVSRRSARFRLGGRL